MKKKNDFSPRSREEAKILFAPLRLCGLFLLLVFLSCSQIEDKIPSGVISKDKMVQLLVDYHLTGVQLDIHSLTDDTESLKQSYYKYAFSKYKTNYPQLKKSFDFYFAHPEIFAKIYDEVITELSKKQAEVSKK